MSGDVQPLGGIVTTKDAKIAEFLRQKTGEAGSGIGREIPRNELAEYAPGLASVLAAFEPADHFMFGAAGDGAYLTAPIERGNHGFWPMRHDYRSVFVLWGPGIKPRNIGQIQMLSIAGRLAETIGVTFPP